MELPFISRFLKQSARSKPDMEDLTDKLLREFLRKPAAGLEANSEAIGASFDYAQIAWDTMEVNIPVFCKITDYISREADDEKIAQETGVNPVYIQTLREIRNRQRLEDNGDDDWDNL